MVRNVLLAALNRHCVRLGIIYRGFMAVRLSVGWCRLDVERILGGRG